MVLIGLASQVGSVAQQWWEILPCEPPVAPPTLIEPENVTAAVKFVITANKEARVGMGSRLLNSVRA